MLVDDPIVLLRDLGVDLDLAESLLLAPTRAVLLGVGDVESCLLLLFVLSSPVSRVLTVRPRRWLPCVPASMAGPSIRAPGAMFSPFKRWLGWPKSSPVAVLGIPISELGVAAAMLWVLLATSGVARADGRLLLVMSGVGK